ncbi:MAG: restriction endonuclease subunit S [Azoarcus sp.]|nr:restriction endonuclease subunit S [Azoarcus sp.]
MALCDQLEQQQTDSLTAHQTLVETLLGTLIRVDSQQEFSAAWARIASHFDTLFTTEASIDQLKQSILQLAVMGKLVPQVSNDEPVDKLLVRILKARQALLGNAAKLVVGWEDALEFNIPVSWQWQPLGNLLIFGPTNGTSPQAVDFETSVRSLTLSATTSGKFKGEHFKFIASDIPAESDLWLRDGDILVQRGNTIEYVGVSAVYHGNPNQFVYPDLMMKLRVSPELSVDFIHLAMSHVQAREFLRSRATGTSGTMPKINQTALKSLPIPIPPRAEQQRIVAKVDELMALCDALKARLADAQTTQLHLADAIVEQAVC